VIFYYKNDPTLPDAADNFGKLLDHFSLEAVKMFYYGAVFVEYKL
jgi:hypothetical protein